MYVVPVGPTRHEPSDGRKADVMSNYMVQMMKERSVAQMVALSRRVYEGFKKRATIFTESTQTFNWGWCVEAG